MGASTAGSVTIAGMTCRRMQKQQLVEASWPVRLIGRLEIWQEKLIHLGLDL